jgi:RNA ligase (TIGR02306 family)
MERKLVSIQTVEDVTPIAGADQIEQARVMGWNVVVQKGDFKSGDPCVFFEIDSVLPDGPAWSEFLRKRGFRIRTMKLRGVLSQGLALPLAILGGDADDRPRDVDLRERLGVSKYEPILPDTLDIAGPFPARVPKTDEIRLQSALGVLEEMNGRAFYVTTKCDGMSATYVRTEDGFIVASRNWAMARAANNPLWRLAEKHGLETKLPLDVAVQGEICGPGVQGNKLELTEHVLFVFNVYDVRVGRYLDYEPFVAFCAAHGLTTVPIERIVYGLTTVPLDRIELAHEAATTEHTLDGWLAAARGRYANTKRHKEGVVIRPLVEVRSETLQGRLSFKVINNDFLLAEQ